VPAAFKQRALLFPRRDSAVSLSCVSASHLPAVFLERVRFQDVCEVLCAGTDADSVIPCVARVFADNVETLTDRTPTGYLPVGVSFNPQELMTNTRLFQVAIKIFFFLLFMPLAMLAGQQDKFLKNYRS